MTSNVGSRKLQDFGEGIGFTTGSKDVKRAEEEKHVITKALKNRFVKLPRLRLVSCLTD